MTSTPQAMKNWLRDKQNLSSTTDLILTSIGFMQELSMSNSGVFSNVMCSVHLSKV